MNKNIAILASGSGTNAENIVRYFQEKNNGIEVKWILTNKQDAYVVTRAKELNVPCRYFTKEEWAKGTDILKLLQESSIDLIVLAGFLLRIPDCLTENYEHRILNIHPALLPKFGGKGMYGMHVHEAVVAAKEKQSGISIHYINKEYDKGEMLFQAVCPVSPTDSAEEVAAKVHALEYEHYPQVIELALEIQGQQ